MAEYPRKVIREHHFERDLRGLIQDVEEADAFVEAAEFVLARDPEIGLRIAPDSNVWGLPMEPIGGEEISLYYTFDESTVWLISIARL
jgi:hypothetical protein